MSSSLLELARKEARFAATQAGFEEAITLTTPDGNTSIELNGLATKHFINFDSDGNPINAKNAHVCISETDLVEAEYPVRNGNNEVNLYNHKVDVADSTGVVKNYVVREVNPNETLGLIVLILGDYKEGSGIGYGSVGGTFQVS